MMRLVATQLSPENFGEHRRIYCSLELLKSFGLYAGDVVLVRSTTYEKFVAGITWPSPENDFHDIFLPSSHYLTLGITPASSGITIEPYTGHKSQKTPRIQEAVRVTLQELSRPPNSVTTNDGRGKERAQNWLELLLRETLVDIRYVVPHQIIPVEYEGNNRLFEISFHSETYHSSSLNEVTDRIRRISLASTSEVFPDPSKDSEKPKMQAAMIWKITWNTIVTIDASGPPPVAVKPDTSGNIVTVRNPYALVGGLSSQIQEIRDLIEIPLVRPELYRQFGLKPPRGILLHGPPGTGKTHLADTISRSFQSTSDIPVSTFHVSGPELHAPYHGETESKVRALFAEARAKSPAIIILDEVDALCPRREERGEGSGVESRVVATLLTEMDGIGAKSGKGDEQKVVVIATTNRINAIDPALRRPGRFDREIEIGIPTASGRAQILQTLLTSTPHSLSSDDIDSIASKTHGYVGADLAAVIREAGTRVIKRLIHPITSDDSDSDGILPLVVTVADILESLPLVSPSALRALTLPVPHTPWSSIGGRSAQLIRQKLNECIAWPLKHPESFERFGIQPPRGVLMYGPPGCSKTMIGRALASESGINFLAVRGPELLNKYVGESERAVRELFSKARSARPCIIFFDEIDALASSRSAFSEGSYNGILTSLLNEMDGLQDSSGVVVVGATNRPEVIDTALMRPGRLDRLIFVGPPSYDDRVEILRIKTQNMAVDPNIDIGEIAMLTDGCSSAELTAVCRDAALLTMNIDMNSPFVPHSHFVEAAQCAQRQITKEVLQSFENWRLKSGASGV